MANLLNEFSEENSLDPQEVKSLFENLYGEFCGHINKASNVGEGVSLFRYWQSNFKEESESNEDFIELLMALNGVGLVTDKAHKAMLLFLDYASEHKVIDIDCSGFVKRN